MFNFHLINAVSDLSVSPKQSNYSAVAKFGPRSLFFELLLFLSRLPRKCSPGISDNSVSLGERSE